MDKWEYKALVVVSMVLLWGCSTTPLVRVTLPEPLTEDNFRSTYSTCLTKEELHNYLVDPNRALWENDIQRSDSLKDIWLGNDMYVGVSHSSKEWQFRVVATTRKDYLAVKAAESVKSCIAALQPSAVVRVEADSSVDLR